jgi:phosphate starvation-inducible PhoH-like protein
MILDEAQNCTVDQIKMFISRMGRNSKVLINGDVHQDDLRGQSGLDYCMAKLEKVNGVAVCKLTYQDIQRNGLIGRVLQALEE